MNNEVTMRNNGVTMMNNTVIKCTNMLSTKENMEDVSSEEYEKFLIDAIELVLISLQVTRQYTSAAIESYDSCTTKPEIIQKYNTLYEKLFEFTDELIKTSNKIIDIRS